MSNTNNKLKTLVILPWSFTCSHEYCSASPYKRGKYTIHSWQSLHEYFIFSAQAELYFRLVCCYKYWFWNSHNHQTIDVNLVGDMIGMHANMFYQFLGLHWQAVPFKKNNRELWLIVNRLRRVHGLAWNSPTTTTPYRSGFHRELLKSRRTIEIGWCTIDIDSFKGLVTACVN